MFPYWKNDAEWVYFIFQIFNHFYAINFYLDTYELLI